MCGGVLYVRAVVRCFMFGRGALDLIEEMESLGSQTFVAIAAQVRVFYHAARGELESAARSREAADLFALQGESTWQTDMYLPALLLDAHFLAGDMVAVRQSAEQLARRAQAMPSFSRYAQYAQAAYHSLRGDLAAALERFETLLERFPAYRGLHWLALRGHYADALNRVGQHQRAKQLLQHALGQAHAEDEIAVLLHLEPQRQLALAEAGLGEHADACRRLDALLAKHGHEDNHLLVGLLHKARVEVSLQMRDEPAARRHLEQLAQHFRATGNPALIAQLERLARSFQAQPPLEPWAQVSAATGASTAVLRSFAGLSTAAERQQRALQLVLAHTRAEQGFLYVLQGDVFRLVAANGNDQPPRHLEDSLRDAGLRSRSEDEADTRVLGQDSNVDASYRVLVLTSRAAQRRLVVGGLILQGNAHAAPDPEFLESIACALHEADSTLATG
ncbi:MAG TPA: hypothetical protein VJR89_35165 [Polyangiales bacterium]|nr:hypothetical protein [Polyangiales bacterium]